MASNHKTRLAPTPSGFLHIGNCYAFVLTYLVAKKSESTLLLRIDDLDRARYRTPYVVNIFKTLELLGIEWDEGPQDLHDFEHHWSQQHRKPLYARAIQTLKENKRVYACSCSRAGHTNKGFDCCLHSRLNPDIPLRHRFPYFKDRLLFQSLSGAAKHYHLPDRMQNFVVQRKNGDAAYQLSSLIDDMHFGCTHIVRGRDLFDSTLAQLALSDVLGLDFQANRFLHHKLLADKGQKLSKRQAAPSALERLKKPEGIAGFYRDFSSWLHLPEPVNTLHELEKVITLAYLDALEETPDEL